jgi:hypothetical protein
VLIEDPQLAGVFVDPAIGVEITTCSGPADECELCPMVMDGKCPLEPVDVVVCALDGPWARSVHAAWVQSGTPVVDERSYASTDADERLDHHLASALHHLWDLRP